MDTQAERHEVEMAIVSSHWATGGAVDVYIFSPNRSMLFHVNTRIESQFGILPDIRQSAVNLARQWCEAEKFSIMGDTP